MAMLRAVIASLTLLLLSYGCVARAGAMAELRDQRLLTNSDEYDGTIINPKICPVDSTWVSFQVVSDSSSLLYIYNCVTSEKRQVSPRKQETSSSAGIPSAFSDKDLAWRPVVSQDEGIWAAFVSSAEGTDELYLYEVNSDKYHSLSNLADSPGSVTRMAPSWSPDGRCLAYSAASSGDFDIYVIRDMDNVLMDPLDARFSREPYHRPLVLEKGSQSGAIWCPTLNSGLLAYMHEDLDSGIARHEIRVFDPRHERSYALQPWKPDEEFFAPSWSPDGGYLAYFVADSLNRLTSGNIAADQDSLRKGHYSLGLASIDYWEADDSPMITPTVGGESGSRNIVDVVPNYDLLKSGPAWLSDGKHLLVCKYDESGRNTLSIIATHLWIREFSMQYWLGSLGNASENPDPSDVEIVGNEVAFTFSKEMKRTLKRAAIELRSHSQSFEELKVAGDRKKWWNAWSKCGKRGGILNWLTNPIAGPNLGINTRGGVICASMAILAAVTAGGGDAAVVSKAGRNWIPPSFPRSQKNSGGVGAMPTF